MKTTRFISDNPQLLSEWDYEKNTNISPDKVSVGSRTIVNWICPDCHGSYSCYAYNRNAGKGCPYCSGKKVLLGFNDLQSKFPDIAKEWDYEENIGLTPTTITAGSRRTVSWICPKGHKYKMSIADRRRGDNCPYCSGRRILPGFNDLQTTHPEVASEWHPTKNGNKHPTEVSHGMTIKIWWKCSKCGNEWSASPNSRTRPSATGCPKCGKLKQKDSRIKTMLYSGTNSLEAASPFLAKEWNIARNAPLLPSQVTKSSNIKVWWICSICGNEWQATINHRFNGRGCPNCYEKSTSFAENAIYFYIKKYFEDARSRDTSMGYELDIYIPSIHTGIEYDGLYFHGKNKRGMSDSTKNDKCKENGIPLIRIRDAGLPDIKGSINIFRENDTNSSLEKIIINLLHILDVKEITPFSIRDDLSDINSLYVETAKNNSLANIRPDITAEWHPTKNGNLNPFQVSVKSGRECYWICPKCNHEWIAPVSSRTSGHGCPRCAQKSIGEINKRKKLKVGINDLKTMYPSLSEEWDYDKNNDDPSMYLPGSNVKKYWKCKECGRSYSATIWSRVHGRGCKICGYKSSSNKLSKQVKCIETGVIYKNATEAARWLGCSTALIRLAAQKKIKKAKGYSWEYC